MDIPQTQSAALYLEGLGISVIPMYPDREKRPAVKWKEYQSRRATVEQLTQWFAGGAPVGLVTGAISGNLVMAEVEGRARESVPQLQEMAHASGLGDLWEKVNRGWVEVSPSGGLHWFFRTVSAPEGNRKLAQRPATPEELAVNPDEKRKVLAETRGEGGYVVVAPTPGWFHETGKPWALVPGTSPASVPTLTDDETEAFLSLLRTLDVPMPGAAARGESRPVGAKTPGPDSWGGISPGDDFEGRTEWDEILVPHGWSKSFVQGGVTYWTRPGKTQGTSASTGKDPARDRLWVFTSSTSFEPEVPYTKFGAYAHLNHGDDYRAAASQLRRDGYGRDPESFGPSTPPRMEATSQGSGTRQDKEPVRLDPSRDHTSPEVLTGSVAPVTDIATKRRPVSVSRTDQGNADLFINEHKSSVRFDTVRKVWFVWEDTKWVQQDFSKRGTVLYRAQQIVNETLPGDSEEARKWRIKCMNPGAYQRIVRIAEQSPQLGSQSDDFDSQPWELNTPAGPVDLRTGALLEPDPAKLHTKSTSVVPDFQADRSAWLAFLAETFPVETESMIEYVQRLTGYTLVGETTAQIIIFCLGNGGNGKGVLMKTLSSILGIGHGYALNMPPGFLTTRKMNNQEEAVAHMKGARFVTIPEIDHNARLDESMAKAFSGGDRMSGKHLYESSFTWEPTHQLWFTANDLPRLDSGGGDSLFRRMKVIPFLHTVPKNKVDRNLEQRLVREHGAAILAWMIEGAVKYHRDGLGVDPAPVQASTGAYRRDMDTFGSFLAAKCIIYPEHQREGFVAPPTVNVLALRDAYKRFCEANNMARPIADKEIGERLRKEFGVVSNKWDPETQRIIKKRGPAKYLWMELEDQALHMDDDGEVYDGRSDTNQQ